MLLTYGFWGVKTLKAQWLKQSDHFISHPNQKICIIIRARKCYIIRLDPFTQTNRIILICVMERIKHLKNERATTVAGTIFLGYPHEIVDCGCVVAMTLIGERAVQSQFTTISIHFPWAWGHKQIVNCEICGIFLIYMEILDSHATQCDLFFLLEIWIFKNVNHWKWMGVNWR